MSRSRPQSGAPNPASRWFEWNGAEGVVRYYDKEAKANVVMPIPFGFILLDQMGTVGGWHDASSSGIYSNEVRDTRTDVFVVKAFKGGVLVEGVYRTIKDRVHTLGGQFVVNCYIAYKQDDALKLGSLRFKGAALGTWMEFTKAHRAELYKKALVISGFTEGKKGRIVYRMPTFTLKDITDETNDQAVSLDQDLQAFLDDYTSRNTREQLVPSEAGAPERHQPEANDYEDAFGASAPLTDDDIPF